MFFKKKKEEETKKEQFFLQEVAERKASFEDGMQEISNSQQQMKTDLMQVITNCDSALEYANEATQISSALMQDIEERRERMQQAETSYMEITTRLEEVVKEATEVVEENKHFTSPSKYLSEITSQMRADYEAYEEPCNRMKEYGKQMGVIALNAAIEAGRLGPAAKQFVVAAEEIRTQAGAYDACVDELTGQLNESKKRIDELEEQIHALLSMLKNSNMDTTKLLKSCVEVTKMVETADIQPFSHEMTVMKDQVTGVRNLGEELLKIAERSKMQLQDIDTEIDTQKEQNTNICETVRPFFETE